ncbi:ESPR-type extended signal peptide-containing protein [Acinetobacter sp. CWB-B33]|uniref:ESPR-type extended signal peptide-containing protein n=1 Tax=Acinetobacter sp. CWB-B33 TaxID=2815724 RepID=UPI0031FEAA1D
MNKVYKVVWNVTLGTWVAVSELAKGHSKTKSKTLKLLALPLAIGGILCSSEVLAASYEIGGGKAVVNNSIAIGTDATTASSVTGANQSIAIGNITKASGDQSIALGANVISSGNSSIAIGGDDIDRMAENKAVNDSYEALTGVRLKAKEYRSTESKGHGSVALGVQAYSEGNFSTAVGMTATSSGVASTALGVFANAAGGGALAIGAISKAQADQSIALGTNSIVDKAAINSIAIGNGAVANNKNSIAMGSGSIANSQTLSNQAYLVGGTAKGEMNIGDRRITGVSAGSADTDAVNVSQLKKAAALAKTTVSNGKNITVKETKNTDGSSNYEVATADDLNVTSVTAGNATLNNNGLAIAGGPSVLASGIDAGSKKVTNVANGDIIAASKDAVNGSQLYQTNQNVTNAQTAADAAQATANKGISFGDGKTNNNYALGETINVKGDSNVTSTTTSDGVQLALAKDITVDSIAAGNNVLNNSGLTIAGGPSVLASGIDAGSKKVTNVANGDISAASKDAVNGSQLYSAQNNIASVIGGSTSIDPNTGNISTSNIGGTGKNTISEAVAAAKTTVSNGKNITVKETKNTDGSTNYAVSTDDNLDVTSLIAGNTTINNNGLTIAGGPSVLASGINAGNQKISNVAKGDVSASSKDAVNGSQLYQTNQNVTNAQTAADAAQATANKGINFGDGKTNNNYQLGNTINVKGDSNVTSTTTSDGVQLALAKDITVDSITAGNTVLNQNGLSFITAAGAPAGPSITATGINAGDYKITQVAKGDLSAQSSDAVNGSQLYAVQQSVDNVITKALTGVQAKFSVASNGDAPSLVGEGAILDIGTDATEKNLNVSRIGTTIDFSLNKDLALDSVTTGATKLSDNGLQFVNATGDLMGPSITVSGINAGDTKIKNVLAGDVNATSKDAVNGSQLFKTDNKAQTALDTANKGFALKAQDGRTVQKALGEAVDVVGADSNIETLVANGQVQIRLGDDINVANSITAGGNTLNAQGLTVGDSILTSNGLSIANGGPSVTSAGIDAGNKVISSVAAGAISSTSQDAVNGSQLYAAQNNVANVIGGTAVVDAKGNISASNIGGTGKNTISEAVAAAKSTVEEGKNITVKETKNTDGSSNYIVATADDLDVKSLKAGNTLINNNGLTIANGPSITLAGINAGNKVISDVAAGSISAASKDAVNGSQLYGAQNNVASLIGGSTVIDPNTGAVTAANIGGTGKNTISEAVAAAKTTVTEGKNITVKETKNADGSSNYQVATADNLDVTSLKAGNTLINNNGLSITGGPSVLASGINAGNKKISNVANGDVTATSSDAVNGSQLYAVDSRIDQILNQNIANLEQGFSLTANGQNTAAVVAGATIDIGTAADEKNLTVTKSGNTIDFALNPDLKVTSVTAGGTVLNDSGLSFVGLDANGNPIATGPSVGVNGIDAGNKKIANVANGDVSASSKDAVNGSQLYSAQNNVANVIGGNTSIDPNTGNISASNIGGTGKNTISEAVAAAKTTVSQGKNMEVKATQNADGSTNYEVATSDNLDVTSLKAGNTAINSNGLSIVGGPSVLASGIDAGNKKIANVANGNVSASSQDAVNGSQLYSAQNNVANVIGGNTAIDPNTGNISTSNIGGTGKNTIDEAVAAAKTTVSQGKNMVVTETKNADGSSDYKVATADNLDVTSLKAGSSLLNNQGLSIVGGPSVLVSGINAGNKKITNVANGSVTSTSQDAVNGSQLYALDSRLDSIINKNINALEKGFNLSANGLNEKAVVAGETIDIGTASTEKNLTVTKTGNTIDFALNPDLTVDSVNAGGTVINADGLSFQTLDANGNIITTGPSISYAGINAGNMIIANVANGAVNAASQDAVNGRQLYNAQNNVANLIGGNTVIDPNTGNITASDIGGTGANNIHDAIQSVNNAAANANQGWNVSTNGGAASNVKPGNTVDFSNADGNLKVSNQGNNITVDLNKDLNLGAAGSVTTGDTKIDDNGLSIAGGPSVTKNGIDAGNKQVTNVADGQIAAGSQDAVNGGQIHDMMGAGAYDAAGNLSNIGGTGANNINDAFAAVNKAATESKTTVTAGSNIDVTSTKNADGSTNYVVATKDDMTLNSVTAKEINADKVVAGNTTIDSNGVSIKNGPSMTASGVDAGNKAVSNVSNGVQTSDAVNMGQLAQYLGGGAGYNNITESFDAPAYNVNGGSYNNVGDALGALNQADQVLGDRITNLGDQLQQAFYSTNQRIDDVEKKANAGIAAAMALENAPYIPGKYTYAAGAAYHGGENAIGVTLRKTADNGRWSLTGGVAAGSSGDPSVRVGISGVID